MLSEEESFTKKYQIIIKNNFLKNVRGKNT